MLLNLEIKNFILIDYHNIEFKKGFTTITGETGAGKSIILDAIGLLMGSRSDSKYQKNKDKKTEIIGDFDLSNSKNIISYLKENDLIDEENENILNIRRIISINGKSNSYVNGVKCSLQTLKNITINLIEINSQNTNRDIISEDYQLEIIDLYCNNTDNLKNLNILFKDGKEKEKSLNKLIKEKEEQQNKRELLSYKLEELKEIDIKEGEYEELNSKYKMLSSAEDLKSNCNNILNNLQSHNLHDTMSELNEMIENKNIIEAKKMLNEAIINLEEVENNVKSEESNIYYDEEELHTIEERIKNIHIISKKHLVDPENISFFINEIESEFNSFNEFDNKILELKEEIESIYQEWLNLAKVISNKRKSVIGSFSSEITDKIKLLKMDNATFKILIQEKENLNINTTGIDKIEFLISTNLGSSFEKIKEAASGGEMSRITLAIKSIISKNENKPIRIFDEVDSGIGGTTGNSIGLFLYEISKFSQVFTITHLAQVASFSDNHFFVYKKDSNNVTNTFIDNLSDKEKLKEMSRMMGYEEFNENNKNMVIKLINNSKEKTLD